MNRETVQRLPKVELHTHLDGCLRPNTLYELARESDRVPSWPSVESVVADMLVDRTSNLDDYLRRFDWTLSVLQNQRSLERVAYEFVCDVAADNIRYVEVRFCPALHTTTLQLNDVMESVLAGASRGTGETGCQVGVIVSALRTMSPRVSEELAQLAATYRPSGVVGFDLAGAELGFSSAEHAAAFRIAAEAGLGLTCHAGEADGPEAVRRAVLECGAQRVGHGTRMRESAAVERLVIERSIPVEMCITSNIHTGTVKNINDHPVRDYFDAGVIVTVNTDSRLMDGVSLTDELWSLHKAFGFSRPELERIILNGCQHAFLDDTRRKDLTTRLAEEMAQTR